MKVIVNFIYEHGLGSLLKNTLLLLEKCVENLEKYLGHCWNGCENCYSTKCKSRIIERNDYDGRK